MSTNPSRKIRFVVSGPSEVPSAKSRQEAKAHAAREAHAKARQARIRRYQASQKDLLSKSGRNRDENVTEYISVPSRNLAGCQTSVVQTQVSASSSHAARGPIYIEALSSLVGSLPPLERFLIHHCFQILTWLADVTFLIPSFGKVCPLIRGMESYQDRLLKDWVYLAMTDMGFLYTILLSTCRHLSLREGRDGSWDKLGVKYKLLCLRDLREAIRKEFPSFGIVTIAKAMAMLFEERATGDDASYDHHLHGVQRMIELSGGPSILPAKGFLEHVYYRVLDGQYTQSCGTLT
ncbi:hypothetical protein HJFPF1_04144 [Paramyrothecium foliicola]|nr:hypothetical protein HJFPF1_04144 [Paramyrothecium foliicola]